MYGARQVLDFEYCGLSDATCNDPGSYRYFHCNIKIICVVLVFPWECIAVNHLYNTLSNRTNLGCFIVCHLERSFTLPLDAINNYNWSFCFFVP